jgi:hypothetical protein
MKSPLLRPDEKALLLGDPPPQHYWIRLGAVSFCGKIGCGIARSPDTEHQPCKGQETETIRQLRNVRPENGEYLA